MHSLRSDDRRELQGLVCAELVWGRRTRNRNRGFSWLSGCQSNPGWIDTIDRYLPGLTLTFLLLQLKIQNSTFSSHTEFGKQYRVVVSNKQCCGWEQEEEREAQGSRDKEWGGRRNLDSSALLDRSWVHSAHLWQHPPPEAIFQSWADAQSSGFSLLPSTKFGKNLMKRLCIRCFLVF